MKRQQILTSVLVLGLLLALAVGLSLAQEPEPPEGSINRVSEVEEAAAVGSRIPVQGRLTDDSGNPLNGTYSIRFRLYDAATGGTALCEDTNSVSVENGLFYSEIYGNCGSDDMDGQQLYLGIKVGTDDEMTDRQGIYPVPYAFSLRPGAVISDTRSGRVLYVRNYGSGQGLLGYSKNHDGVYGWSDASDHAGVSGENTGGGVGVYGWSNSGPAIKAAGRIESTANSYVWISGNDLRKKNPTDTTQFECDVYGGVKATRGADTGTKDVMLPVTLPGQLYGQDVTLTGIDVYFESETDFDGIGVTAVRRQSGAGSGDLIRWDDTDRVCESACSYHLDLTTNNVLDDEHGVVYIAFQLFFSGSSTYVQIGGVRLTLEHD